MERLKTENLNTAGEYNRIFREREVKEPNWSDLKRWKALLKHYKGGMITDVGCLDSLISEFFDEKLRPKDVLRSIYIGTDLAPEAIERMTEKHGSTRVKFFVDDLYQSKLKTDAFDYVVLGEVLEHLERPLDAVKEAFRILKPGGVLAISVPLEEAKEPGAVDGDRHLWSFNERDIRNMVQWYSKDVKTKVLRSQWFPKYRYCWPQLIVWAWKK